MLRYADACIVSAPAARVAALSGLEAKSAEEAFDADALLSQLNGAVERIVGPAWQGYVAAAAFRPLGAGAARMLSPSDHAALRELAQSCVPEEWAHGAIDRGGAPVFAVFDGDDIVSAASVLGIGEGVPSIGVVTHPMHRGRGHGGMAVASATAYGLERVGFVTYQTLVSNTHAVAIARKLGFEQYATTLAVRLR